jgi:hypothetical protein
MTYDNILKFINKTTLILFYIILIITIIVHSRPTFLKTELYWLIYITLFFIILDKLNFSGKLILIFIFMQFKTFRIGFLYFFSVFSSILFGAHEMIRHFMRYILYNELNLKENFIDIPRKPTIFMCNYPATIIEYLFHTIVSDKLCLISGSFPKDINPLKRIFGNKNVISSGGKSFDKTKEIVKEKIKEGYSIFLYPERKYKDRKNFYDISELRSGFFSIAKQLDITITPIVIDHIYDIYGIPENNYFQIKIGNTKYVNNIEESLNETFNFLKKELNNFKLKKFLS